MRRGQWLVYLWPGLPELWRHGTWSALALACGFAAMLNLAFAVSLVWTQWLAAELEMACWAAVMVLGCWGFWSARRQAGEPETARDLFSRALGEYLHGNWFEAELLLRQILKQDRQDVDAHLMLASLFRHTARLDDARRTLAQLSRLEGAAKWELEIEREQRLLDRLEAAEAQEPVPQQPASGTPAAVSPVQGASPSHAARAA